MWHFIFEKIPADRDVLLAVLDHDGFHALDFHVASATMAAGSTQKWGTPSKFTRRIGASGLLTSTDRSSLGRPFLGEAPPVSKTRCEMAHEIEPRAWHLLPEFKRDDLR